MSADNKKGKDFSSKVVISAIIAVIGYTVTHLYFSWHDKIIPTQLTISWFTFWGVELGALAGIEIKKKLSSRSFIDDVNSNMGDQ